MALILKAEVDTSSDCKSFNLADTTGTYNADTNPGGYGTPNPTTSSIGEITISIYPPKSTVPYILFIEVDGSGVVTAATLTAPDGTITDVTEDFADVTFPFEEDVDELPMPNTYFGLSEDQELTDGVWTFIYGVDTKPDATNTTVYLLTTCTACCCNQKQYLNLKNCNCEDNKIGSAQTVNAWIKSAQYAANLGMYDEAQAAIDKANEVCAGNCKDC
jgi:hypothetical protein